MLQEAAEAMSLDKETMEKEVEQAVSAFEENIGAEELDGRRETVKGEASYGYEKLECRQNTDRRPAGGTEKKHEFCLCGPRPKATAL